MSTMTTDGTAYRLDLAGLGSLLTELSSRGYEMFGPQVRDGAIAHDAAACHSADQTRGAYRFDLDDGTIAAYSTNEQRS